MDPKVKVEDDRVVETIGEEPMRDAIEKAIGWRAGTLVVFPMIDNDKKSEIINRAAELVIAIVEGREQEVLGDKTSEISDAPVEVKVSAVFARVATMIQRSSQFELLTSQINSFGKNAAMVFDDPMFPLSIIDENALNAIEEREKQEETETPEDDGGPAERGEAR